MSKKAFLTDPTDKLIIGEVGRWPSEKQYCPYLIAGVLV
jgi:hypothetical protein